MKNNCTYICDYVREIYSIPKTEYFEIEKINRSNCFIRSITTSNKSRKEVIKVFEDKPIDIVAAVTQGVRGAPYKVVVTITATAEADSQFGGKKTQLICSWNNGAKIVNGFLYAGKRLENALRPFKFGDLLQIERIGTGFDTNYKVQKVKG